MPKQRRNKKRLLAPLIALTALLCTPLHAIDYDVEVIIFEHVRNTTVGSSNTLLAPVVRNAQQIPVSPTPGAEIQPIGELRLQAEAEKIRSSNNHRLMYHGGWRQGALDKENAPFISIAMGQSYTALFEQGDADSLFLRGYRNPSLNTPTDLQQRRSSKLSGGIKVWVGRFLHFDTLLSYTPTDANYSFSFESERRLRSRQLHYIDNPRVGIITKIFPVDDTAPN